MNDLCKMVLKAGRIVFFGGAGVSTESGIPDFRSAHGLYQVKNKIPYEEMLHHDFFVHHTDEFYEFYKKVMLYPDAKPNEAHKALVKLEQCGKLKAVLTQNIDGLHQMAGSKNVLELHGSVNRNYCMKCAKKYNMQELLNMPGTPRCSCGGLIRPDVVLYGEMLDDHCMNEAIRYIKEADLLIVGGTSLVVYPVAGLVRYVRPDAKLVIINQQKTNFDYDADLVIHDSICKVLQEVTQFLKI